MTPKRHIRLLRACLGCLLVLGALTLAYAAVWTPVRHASLVDVILTPAEVRDPTKVDIVYRTLRYVDGNAAAYGVIGAVVVACALCAWFILERDRRGRFRAICR